VASQKIKLHSKSCLTTLGRETPSSSGVRTTGVSSNHTSASRRSTPSKPTMRPRNANDYAVCTRRLLLHAGIRGAEIVAHPKNDRHNGAMWPTLIGRMEHSASSGRARSTSTYRSPEVAQKPLRRWGDELIRQRRSSHCSRLNMLRRSTKTSLPSRRYSPASRGFRPLRGRSCWSIRFPRSWYGTVGRLNT